MSKVLLYSDNHFCDNSSVIRSRGEKYSIRLENQIKTLQFIYKMAKLYHCNDVFCLGDFFDKPTLNAEELSALSQIKFGKFYNHFIVGNHEMGEDKSNFNSSSVFALNSVENTRVYSLPTILEIDDIELYILPYQTSLTRKEHVLDYFSRMPKDKRAVLLMHNDIKGIRMGKFISQDGFDIEDIQKHFDLCFNGHLHNGTEIAENIINIGNITGQNFSENAMLFEHHAILLDCETLEYEYIPNPFALNFYKFDFISCSNEDIEDSLLNTSNACMTIKVRVDQKEFVENTLSKISPIYSRVLVENVPISTNDTVVYTSKKIDHLQQFREFVLSKSCDELTEAELNEVLS